MTPRGKILVSGVGPMAHYHNGYLFHVAFIVPIMPSGQIIAAGVPSHVQVMVNIHKDVIYGAKIPSTGGLFDVLLGMDVLSSGLLWCKADSSAFRIELPNPTR